MREQPTRKSQGSHILHSIGATPAPLWLLQKEDNRFLYLSFILSTLVHAILIIVMAATRIFHPIAGASAKFDLVWLSTPAVSGTKEPVNVREAPPVAKSAVKVPATPEKAPVKQKVANQTPEKAVIPEKQTAKPAERPPEVPPAVPEVSKTGNEMVITRYGGKVVEIADRKKTVPTFRTFSTAEMKTAGTRAIVRTISEKKANVASSATVAKVIERNNQKKSEVNIEHEKRDNSAKTASAESAPVNWSLAEFLTKSLPGRQSSSAPETRSAKDSGSAHKRVTEEHPSMAGVGTPGAPETVKQAVTEGGKGETVSEGGVAPANPSAGIPQQKPVSAVQGPEPSAEKPSPPTAEKPQAIFHPPLVGDLKLIITGESEIKVVALFTEYRKARRGKPISRWEARNRRNIIPKVIRTREKVNEAVIEVTEEGIYDLTVKSADGKSAAASFVLKVHESAPGAKTRDLGRRSVMEGTTIARILMPEGILWDDDSSFSGNMEDSESITKFNAETGLIWREYK